MPYYTKQTWTARVGEGLNKFTDANSGNTLILTSTPDSISEEGTPFTAERMNYIEDGIYRYSFHYGTADPSTLSNPSEGQLYFKII